TAVLPLRTQPRPARTTVSTREGPGSRRNPRPRIHSNDGDRRPGWNGPRSGSAPAGSVIQTLDPAPIGLAGRRATRGDPRADSEGLGRPPDDRDVVPAGRVTDPRGDIGERATAESVRVGRDEVPAGPGGRVGPIADPEIPIDLGVS